MIKLVESADHSPKDRFAAYSTLDRAVYTLTDKQRAALMQPPTHAYHRDMSTAVHSVYTNITHIITVAVTKARGW